MKTAPRISIVTAGLNRADLLRHTIASVRAQSFRDFEHIVVDGASTDGTVPLLRSLEGAYPMRWRSEPDGGMYEAINKGLAMARGEILAYLNSDDLYFPWTLEVVVRAFGRHPDMDFVYGDALSVDDATGARRMYWQFPFRRDYVCRSGFLAQPTVFWRRRAWETLGPFDETLRFVADCDFWMRASERFRFHKVDELLAVERDHGDTLRTTGAGALALELAAVRSRHVTTSGIGHRVAHVRNVRVAQVRERFYALAFLLQSRLPRGHRFAPWRRFLDADEPALRASTALRLLLPRQTEYLYDVMNPSRRWLEPEP